MSKTYEKILMDLNKPKPLGHAERNRMNIKAVKAMTKQIELELKGLK